MKKLIILLSVLIFTSKGAIAAINTDAMLQYNQGIDFYKVGQYDQAVNSFRTAINLDPNYIDAYYNLGAVIGIMTFIVLAVVSLVTYHNTASYKDEEGFQ